LAGCRGAFLLAGGRQLTGNLRSLKGGQLLFGVGHLVTELVGQRHDAAAGVGLEGSLVHADLLLEGFDFGVFHGFLLWGYWKEF
jgi:hypothetical protein